MACLINAKSTGVGGIDASGDASGVLALQTGGTTAVTIDASQNVGIGTSSPTNRLEVNGTGYFYNGLNVSNGSPIQSKDSGGTLYNMLYMFSDNNVYVSSPVASSSLIFRGTGYAERMRIDASGNVLVGTTTVQNSAKLSLAITSSNNGVAIIQTNDATVNDKILFGNTNGIVGYIRTLNTATTYSTASDYRLKENILPMVGALNTVAQLKPVTYSWKSDGLGGQGFIAHELQAIVPDCVTGEKDAVNEDGTIKPQGIDTSFLVATLTSAIQELKAIIDLQQNQITALNAKVGI